MSPTYRKLHAHVPTRRKLRERGRRNPFLLGLRRQLRPYPPSAPSLYEPTRLVRNSHYDTRSWSFDRLADLCSTPDLDKPDASCDHLQRPFLRYTADYVLSPAIVLFLGKPGNVYTSRSRTKFPTQRSNMETLITFKAGQCDFDVGISPNSFPMHAPLSLRRPVDANSDPRPAPPHPASLQSKPQVTSTSMKKTSLSISAGGLDPPQVQTLSSTS